MSTNHFKQDQDTKSLSLLILLLLLLPIFGFGGETLPKPTQVSSNAWAWIGPYGPPTKENRGFRMNLGLVVGKDAVAVIDSGYGDYMADVMLAQIEQMNGLPVRYVINTDSQPHRILGNAVFHEHGAEIIASKEALPRIRSEGAVMASTAEGILELPSGSIQAPGTPDRLIAEVTILDLGGVTLKVIPVGTAHTAGSLIVEVVQDRIVYTGDVLYGDRLPTILPISRVDKWIEAFDSLRDYAGFLLVPGHGKPGTLDRFGHSTYEYLTTLKTHMDNAVEEGIELQDAINSLDQSPWKSLANFDLLEGRNAHQTYLEREAAGFE